MAPALLTTNLYASSSSSNIYSTYSSDMTTTTSLTYPRTAVSPALLSPAFSDHSSSSHGSGSVTPTQATAAPAASASAIMFAQRKLSKKPSNSSLRVQPCLPDISEASPTTPTMQVPSLLRAPGTGRPLSVLSEVSVASNDSDSSQATIDRYKFRFLNDDVESVMEGSVFDGDEEEDLRKAERALAGVRQKLHAFESNIHKARDSLLSPAMYSGSSLGSPDRAQPSTLKTLSRGPSKSNIHNRTVSDGASSQFAGSHHRKTSTSTMTSSSSDHFTDAYTSYRANSALSSRSRSSSRASTTQVQELEDQMNSLKGRLTQLTEKTRRESLRRRSMNALRTPLNNIYHQPEPASINPDSLISPTSYTTADDQFSDAGSEEGSRSGTPKPYAPLRKTMSYEELGYDSAFSAPGDETPSMIYSPRRNRVRDYRSNSSAGSSNDSCGANTPVMPLHQPPRIEFQRNNSASSVASFETAMEDYEEPSHVTPLSYRPHRRTPSNTVKTSPLRAVMDEPVYEEPTASAGDSSQNDDGYHSGPSTPQGLEEESYLPIQGTEDSKSLPLTRESLNQVDAPLSLPRQSRAKSATNSIIGAQDDELALKLPVEDRELVENLCDQLGKVCCKLEMARTPAERAEIRRRMEVAMMVLQGMTNI
ncbi:hypothetical protein ABW19_dt0202247 [Dactylella cylindrospora]|nr:hypothetical protein ABW19_dt0202247 [Dactylella cylindrospora]